MRIGPTNGSIDVPKYQEPEKPSKANKRKNIVYKEMKRWEERLIKTYSQNQELLGIIRNIIKHISE